MVGRRRADRARGSLPSTAAGKRPTSIRRKANTPGKRGGLSGEPKEANMSWPAELRVPMAKGSRSSHPGIGRLRQQRGATPTGLGKIAAMADIAVSLWRGKADGRYQVYRVPRRDNQTVLDVVTWVQRHADPTLSYRFACRVGMCGSCAMTVNGRPRWTCRTHTAQVVQSRQTRDRPARQSADHQRLGL